MIYGGTTDECLDQYSIYSNTNGNGSASYFQADQVQPSVQVQPFNYPTVQHPITNFKIESVSAGLNSSQIPTTHTNTQDHWNWTDESSGGYAASNVCVPDSIHQNHRVRHWHENKHNYQESGYHSSTAQNYSIVNNSENSLVETSLPVLSQNQNNICHFNHHTVQQTNSPIVQDNQSSSTIKTKSTPVQYKWMKIKRNVPKPSAPVYNFPMNHQYHYGLHTTQNFPVGTGSGRTNFTTRQLTDLEKEFLVHKYVSKARRIEISLSLGLNENQVKIWFQNRRMKQKKKLRDRLVSGSSSGATVEESIVSTSNDK